MYKTSAYTLAEMYLEFTSIADTWADSNHRMLDAAFSQ